jgi:hypothetical protein
LSGTHEVKQRWVSSATETIAASKGGFHFADQGRLFCSGFGKEPDQSHVECRDTQTGSIIATNPNVVLWAGSIHSSGGGLLAITDYNITDRTATLWKLLDAGGRFIVPRRRLIWNIRTGKEIASWTFPLSNKIRSYSFQSTQPVEPARCRLSTVSYCRCRRTLIGSNAGSGSDRLSASTAPLPQQPQPKMRHLFGCRRDSGLVSSPLVSRRLMTTGW